MQVFYELLRLIKEDKERRRNPPEIDPKSTASHITKRSSMTSRRNGSTKSVPGARNSTRKTITKKKRKKSLGRRRRRYRNGVRNFRRRMRRVWRRIATCRVV